MGKVVCRRLIVFVMDFKFFSYVAFKTMESPAGTINPMIYLQYLELG